MADNSKIEWTDSTFNPWIGCTKVSPACDRCYAETQARRHGWAEWGNHPRYRTSSANWRKPLAWQRQARQWFETHGRRRRVFCASLADVFDNQIDPAWRADLWSLIRDCPDLDWQLLTKRPQNILKMLPADWRNGWSHVWLGTTCEDQARADQNIPHLLDTPAAVRFVSAEPLIRRLNLNAIKIGWRRCQSSPDTLDALRGEKREGHGEYDGVFETSSTASLDWVIVGGESGPGARPMHPDWARTIRDQCNAAGVPFFMKQMGGGVKSRMPMIPPDLNVRDFPEAA